MIRYMAIIHNTNMVYGCLQLKILVVLLPRPQLFRASTFVGGEFVINGAYPVKFLPLGTDGVTITFFPSIHEVRTRPSLYEKKPQ